MGYKDLNRIILHWTAGTYNPTQEEINSYHYLIDGDSNIHYGKFAPWDNIVCSGNSYAHHTGGGNTGSIGISLCGMAGYQEGKISTTKYPLKQIQVERACKLAGDLCRLCDIDYKHVMTHYEFGLANPKTSSAGKIDIMIIPYDLDIKPQNVGDYLRTKVNWYQQNK